MLLAPIEPEGANVIQIPPVLIFPYQLNSSPFLKKKKEEKERTITHICHASFPSNINLHSINQEPRNVFSTPVFFTSLDS